MTLQEDQIGQWSYTTKEIGYKFESPQGLKKKLFILVPWADFTIFQCTKGYIVIME